MNKLYGYIRKGLHQPELDDFVLEAAVDTIKTKKPNLLLVHFTDLDTQRHEHGFSSKEAILSLHRHNQRLGRLIEALKAANIYEQSTIIALGDHSALDEQKAINLNVLFTKQNLITTNTNGKLINWKAYCKSCDGSAYIYLNTPEDQSTFQTVHNLLNLLIEEPDFGIEKFITGEEAAARGADGSSAFMIEARPGFYFLEDYSGEFIKHITEEDTKASKKYTRACHGYSPEKENYGTILMAAGNGIQQGTLPSIRLIDEGPTFARLLGVSLGDTDGKVIDELLTLKGEVT